MFNRFELTEEQKRRKRIEKRNNTIAKWSLTLLVLMIMSIPADLFFLIKSALQPVGFWQNFAVWVGGIAIFGTWQIWFVVIGFGILVSVIWD